MDGIWKVVIAVFVAAVTIGLTFLIINPQKTTEIVITPGFGKTENRVGIFSAVKEPGTYSYEGNIRVEDAVKLAGGETDEADLAHANLSQWIRDGETVIIPTLGVMMPTLTLPVAAEEIIDLNSADKAELMKLPGIGEKRADEIIQLREKLGKFERPEDILVINGISEKLLDNIYDRVITQ